MKVRYFDGRKFECVQPGLWMTDDLYVLREEFRGMRNYHSWIAERWEDRDSWRAAEHFGYELSMSWAAERFPKNEKIYEKLSQETRVDCNCYNS